MSILEKFGIDASAFAAITDTTLFEGTGTTTLRAGKRVPYTGSINGTTIPCYVTMHEAKLTRLSLLKQLQVSSNREYWLATGILKPVKMDIELMIDGEAINLIDFLHNITQQASNSTFSRDEFVMNSRRIGFNFDEGMPMFFQQFGASFDGFGHAINAFKAAGATDVIGKIQNAGRIQAAYALGASKLAMIRAVVIPYGRGGVVGGAMLGLGRAMGETVAVYTVLNVVYQINWQTLFGAGGNVASLILLKFGEAGPEEVNALMAAGLVLFLLTLTVNAISDVLINRFGKKGR